MEVTHMPSNDDGDSRKQPANSGRPAALRQSTTSANHRKRSSASIYAAHPLQRLMHTRWLKFCGSHGGATVAFHCILPTLISRLSALVALSLVGSNAPPDDKTCTISRSTGETWRPHMFQFAKNRSRVGMASMTVNCSWRESRVIRPYVSSTACIGPSSS